MNEVTHDAYRVDWSAEDSAFVATVVEFPSLSWVADDQAAALGGLRELVAAVIADLERGATAVPGPIGDRAFSGKLSLRIAPVLHRKITLRAAEQRVSLNRYIEQTLAGVQC